jgi:serine/threonine protein kinase/tetratricopeptide (TPR) repeat protein
MDSQAAGPEANATTGGPEIGGDFLEFRLIDELGRGAFGKVYLARQGKLADRPVVLKISSRLDGEPRMLAQLQHTNIVPIYSIHRADRLQAVCMPYHGSTTLKDVYEVLESQRSLPESGLGLISTLNNRKAARESRGETRSDPPSSSERTEADRSGSACAEAESARPRPAAETLKYLEGLTYVEAVLWMVSRLASGLAHAHERGILHLDLKPANILVTDEGQPMLLDFNLSMDLKLRSLAGPAVGGTILYMSPEQLEASRGAVRRLDGRSDIYSLGIILFELLTGRRPFAIPDGPTEGLILALLEGRKAPPAVGCWNKGVSPAVESIVQHCLEPDPDRRYRGARELREDIECHLGHGTLRHAREPSVRERATKWMRRHPTASSTTSIAALAIASLALLGWGSWLAVREARVARARLQHLDFRRAFEECQFLLNTAQRGPRHSLRRGVRRARRALEVYGDGRRGDWGSSPLVRDLPRAERTALGREAAELIILEVRARVALAEQAGSREDPQAAYRWGLDRLEWIRRINPRTPAAFHRDRARLLAAIGREGESARERALAAAEPLRSPQDEYLLGTSLLADGHPDRAEVYLGRAVARDPRGSWSWFALGLCHSDQGRHADAASDFAACTILAPRFAWPHLNRGLALARCGRLMEALAAYDRAVKLAPRLAEARLDRGLAHLELGSPEPALRDLAGALALGLRTPAVLAAHAEALARLDRPGEADRAFDAAIRDDPSDPLLRVARGFARLGRDRAGAAADFRRALELDPSYPRAHLGRAHLVRHQDPRAALDHLEQALAADPEFGDALQLRALIRARLNDPAAEIDVDRFLRVTTPQRLYNAACTLSILARVRGEARLRERALEYLRRALDAGLSPDYPALDPDLEPLRGSPRFAGLIAAARRDDPPRP